MAISYHLLARVMVFNSEFAAAESLSRKSLALARALPEPDDLWTAEFLRVLSWIRASRGDNYEFLSLLRESFEIKQDKFGSDIRESMPDRTDLAWALLGAGKLDEAELLIQEALDATRGTLTENHPSILVCMRILGRIHREKGRSAEAVALGRDLVERTRITQGEEHYDYALALGDLGLYLKDMRQFEEADLITRQSLARYREHYPDDRNHDVRAVTFVLADLQLLRGNLDEAERLFRYSLELSVGLWGEDNHQIAWQLIGLGSTLVAGGEASEAEPLLRKAYHLRNEHFAADAWQVGYAASELGGCLGALGRYDEAEKFLLQGESVLLARTDSVKRWQRDCLSHLVALYRAWGKPTKSVSYVEKLKSLG